MDSDYENSSDSGGSWLHMGDLISCMGSPLLTLNENWLDIPAEARRNYSTSPWDGTINPQVLTNTGPPDSYAFQSDIGTNFSTETPSFELDWNFQEVPNHGVEEHLVGTSAHVVPI